MSWRVSWICALVLAACGQPAEPGSAATAGGEMTVAENTNAPPPPVEEGAAPPVARGYPGRSGSGTSPEDPIGACGPRDSYEFVAGEFRCPDGSNPLGGDPMAAARVRAGNVGANSTGHIIDLYRVPCASGDVEVYVDMYGCPEMQGMFGE